MLRPMLSMLVLLAVCPLISVAAERVAERIPTETRR
jgi:hypothetical protein